MYAALCMQSCGAEGGTRRRCLNAAAAAAVELAWRLIFVSVHHSSSAYYQRLTETIACRPGRRHCIVITCATACFVFSGVCLSVCPRKNWKKPLVRKWCNLIWVCLMVKARRDWILVTFNLDLWVISYFCATQQLLFLRYGHVRHCESISLAQGWVNLISSGNAQLVLPCDTA